MKNLKLLDKFIFLMNSVVACTLLFSYILPYISPDTFPVLSVFSLTVPLLIIVNVLFLAYWIIKLKKQFLLSLLVLLIGTSHITSLYNLGSNTRKNHSERDISVLNYNVRMFNHYKWIASESVGEEIMTFVNKEDPAIFCVQEYYDNKQLNFTNFKYKYVKLKKGKSKSGQAIFSQYPIINKGSLDFENTGNNIIYIDIVVDRDTIRVYNVHLESLKISPQVEKLKEEDSEKLLGRIGSTFKMQQHQTERFIEHLNTSPYKVIISGDFNNTAYSYIYNKIVQENVVDTFKDIGKGFGQTFDFNFFPIRIDFILVSKEFDIVDFENYDVKLSDHYPIMTRVRYK
ncbi:endonuclease/exonuclease/phosphatase family protein [Aquimarina rhabdastrellae]